MRRTIWCGVGAIVVGIAGGCSGEDAGPGSEIGQNKAGTGGTGGSAGSISLDLPGGAKGGGGAGGMGGGSAGATAAGTGSGGTGTAGTTSQAGTSSGGAKPAGMCKRVTASDADCLDFYPAEPPDPARPQAYACDDAAAYVALNRTKDGNCASVSFVTGSRYGACCPQ